MRGKATFIEGRELLQREGRSTVREGREIYVRDGRALLEREGHY